MLLTLRCDNGRRIVGLLLAMNDTQSRIAVRGLNETLEFRRVNGLWFTDKGDFVEVESIISAPVGPAVMKVGHA